jgi:hypothetical protein
MEFSLTMDIREKTFEQIGLGNYIFLSKLQVMSHTVMPFIQKGRRYS